MSMYAQSSLDMRSLLMPEDIARPDNISQYFGECSVINLTFIGYDETSSYWLVQFFSDLQWLLSIGKPRMTAVSFIKTTESYEICRLGYYLGSTFNGTDRTGGLITVSDQTKRAMHSSNSWLISFNLCFIWTESRIFHFTEPIIKKS